MPFQKIFYQRREVVAIVSKNKKTKSALRWQAIDERHAMRCSKYGRELELFISNLLKRLKAERKISSFTYHEPYSDEDLAGKDFTIQNGKKTVSFDVTISLKHWKEKQKQHPNIPVLCFPIGTTPERMEQRILELLQ